MVWCWLVAAATGFVNVPPVNVVNRRSTDQRTDGAATSHAALRRELRETVLIDRDNGSCVCVCVCVCLCLVERRRRLVVLRLNIYTTLFIITAW